MLDVVVLKGKFWSLVHPDTVHDTGVIVAVVNDNIVAAQASVDDRHDALIAEVKKQRTFFLGELSEFFFKLNVRIGFSTHDTSTHWVSETIFRRGLGIYFAHLGVIGKAEVRVKAPDEAILTTEFHVGTELTFQFGEGEIAVGDVLVLTERPVIVELFEKIFHLLSLWITQRYRIPRVATQ